MTAKIVDIVWIGGRHSIGVALCLDDITQKHSARIAPIDGTNMDMDASYIRDWGSKLSYKQAKGFFPNIKEDEYK